MDDAYMCRYCISLMDGLKDELARVKAENRALIALITEITKQDAGKTIEELRA